MTHLSMLKGSWNAMAGLGLVASLVACTPAADPNTPMTSTQSPAFQEADRIDEIIEAALAEEKIAGIAVAVVRSGEVLMAKGYGLADIENNVPIGPETMFQSGSVGKMFTAAAIMTLVEDGLLDLEVSIKTWIPEGPDSWDDITLRNLLSHTSGIPDYTSDDMDYTRDYAEEDLVRMAGELDLEFAPGARWNYSNTGYVLLGIIIQRVAEKPYWELLRERVWDPANVPTMRVNFATDIVPHRSSGYNLEDDTLVNQGWVAPSLNSTADGSLLFSLEDLIAWNDVVRNRTVLSTESWQAMLTPFELNSGNPYSYGFGWSIDEIGGHPVHQHGGGWQGFRTHFTRFVDDDVAIVVLANTSHASPGQLADQIAGVIDPTYKVPDPPTEPIEDTVPQVTALVSAKLGKASRGDLELSDFAFIRQTSLPWVRDGLAETLDNMGEPDRMELLDIRQEGDDRLLRYRASYGADEFAVRAAVDPSGGLTMLWATKDED